VDFECDCDATLSWYRPRAEAADLVKAFYKGPDRTEKHKYIENRVEALKRWFGEGGR
jgi:hypothetical protein